MDRNSHVSRPIQTESAKESMSLTPNLGDFFVGGPGERSQYSDHDIQEISDHLRDSQRTAWSLVPRLYIVLRTISQLHLLDLFIDQGVNDYWFPFDARSVQTTTLSSPAQSQFLEAQKLVLTRAIDLEKSTEKRHIHFSGQDTIPFKVLGELGRGGYGKVDKVYSQLSQRELARKLFRRTRGGNKTAVQSFINEIRVLKRIQHQHCVELIASYTDSKYFGIIMSPVAESNLHGFYARASRNPEDSKLLRKFFGCLASAVHYLHANKIRHRDIKPENILVKGTDIYLTDFGISLDWENLSRSTTVAESGKTPVYCAPEVANHQKRNSASDIWSLGCVFLEMCTILKGRTLEEMRRRFKDKNDTYTFCRNLPVIADWSHILQKCGSELDDDPIEWSMSMLQFDPNSRPIALTLRETISRCRLWFSLRWGTVGRGLGAEDLDDEVTSPPLTHSASNAADSKSSISADLLTFDNNSLEDRSLPNDSPHSTINPQISPANREQQYDRQDGSKMQDSMAKLHLVEGISGRSVPGAVPLESQSQQVGRTHDNSDLVHRKQVKSQGSYSKDQQDQQSIDAPKYEATIRAARGTNIEHPPGYEDINEFEELSRGPSTADSSGAPSAVQSGHYQSRRTADDAYLNASDKRGPYPQDRGEKLPKFTSDDWETPSNMMKVVENDEQLIGYLFEKYSELPAIQHSGPRYINRVMQLLIENGLDVNDEAYRDNKGRAPIWKVLGWSTEDEFESLFSYMIQMGAHLTVRAVIDEGGSYSMFKAAAWSGKMWAVSALVRCKAEKIDDWQHDLCLGAVSGDQLQILQYLIRLDIFRFNRADRGGEPWITIACRFGADEGVKFMLDSAPGKFDINACWKRCAPLYVACRHGHLEVVRQLMAHGASPDRLDKTGHSLGITPLQVATKHGHYAIVQHLLEVVDYGRSINWRHDGVTALSLACEEKHFEITRLLLEHGADPNINLGLKSGNWSPLHGAVMGGKADIVKLLLDHGANPTIRAVPVISGRFTGETPLSLAEDSGRTDIVELLELAKARERIKKSRKRKGHATESSQGTSGGREPTSNPLPSPPASLPTSPPPSHPGATLPGHPEAPPPEQT